MRLGSEHNNDNKPTAYDDFASILEESRFERLKPVLKGVVAICLVALCSFGVYMWIHKDAEKQNQSAASMTQEGDAEKTESEQAATPAPAVNSNNPDYSSTNSSVPNTATSKSTSSSPQTTSNYDPHKCDTLNSDAANLRSVADQKKQTYDAAFAARKDWGYFYDQNHQDKTLAQQAYDAQEANLDALQKEWSDALAAGNAAYSKFQTCQANNN